MDTKTQVIAICRVSTDKQSRLGHSLENQLANITRSVEQNDWEIARTWSTPISSKHGKNLNRSDIKEALAYCGKNKKVKYCIVDEPTRLMRSVDEALWFKTELAQKDVELYFASYPEYNSGDSIAKLKLIFSLFSGESENEKRMSIVRSGMAGRVRAGFFPHQPKAGYMKSTTPGLHIADPDRFPLLKDAMLAIAKGTKTVKQALDEMNAAGYHTLSGHKMDATHFRIILEDPYYYGKIKVKDIPLSTGLHEPMISEHDYNRIQARTKGTKPRTYTKHFNPEYPLKKIVSCGLCGAIDKITGSTSTNAQKRKYKRYQCRECRKSFDRDVVHENYLALIKRVYIRPELTERFMDAVIRVWHRRNADRMSQIEALKNEIAKLDDAMANVAAAFARATQDAMRSQLEKQMNDLQRQQIQLEDRLATIQDIDAGIDKFARFVADFMSKLPENWFDLDPETRLTCQKLIFPGDLQLHQSGKVSTTKISPIYRLLDKKKAPAKAETLFLVTSRRIELRLPG